MPYKLSDAGYKNLLKEEGNRLAVYDDATGKPIPSYEAAKGYPTIGLGILITDALKDKFRPYLNGAKASPEFMDGENKKKIAEFENSLNKKLGGVALTGSMFDALFSLAWNTGTNSKTVNKVIALAKEKKYKEAADAIANGPQTSKGKKLDVLVKRRAKEAQHFLAEGFEAVAKKVEEASDVARKVYRKYGVFDDPMTWIYIATAITIGGLAFKRHRLRSGR